jgi:hypothetical protein
MGIKWRGAQGLQEKGEHKEEEAVVVEEKQ